MPRLNTLAWVGLVWATGGLDCCVYARLRCCFRNRQHTGPQPVETRLAFARRYIAD